MILLVHERVTSNLVMLNEILALNPPIYSVVQYFREPFLVLFGTESTYLALNRFVVSTSITVNIPVYVFSRWISTLELRGTGVPYAVKTRYPNS
jgi:hypothetical protein